MFTLKNLWLSTSPQQADLTVHTKRIHAWVLKKQQPALRLSVHNQRFYSCVLQPMDMQLSVHNQRIYSVHSHVIYPDECSQTGKHMSVQKNKQKTKFYSCVLQPTNIQLSIHNQRISSVLSQVIYSDECSQTGKHMSVQKNKQTNKQKTKFYSCVLQPTNI